MTERQTKLAKQKVRQEAAGMLGEPLTASVMVDTLGHGGKPRSGYGLFFIIRELVWRLGRHRARAAGQDVQSMHRLIATTPTRLAVFPVDKTYLGALRIVGGPQTVPHHEVTDLQIAGGRKLNVNDLTVCLTGDRRLCFQYVIGPSSTSVNDVANQVGLRRATGYQGATVETIQLVVTTVLTMAAMGLLLTWMLFA